MQHIVSRGHSRPLTEISFTTHNDLTLLMSSAHDKTPQVRHGETGNWIGSFLGHKGAVWSAKIDASQTLCVTGSGDFTAKLWCATSGKELHEFKHKHVVRTVDFSQDSRRIISGCQNGQIRTYDTCHPANDPQILNESSLSRGDLEGGAPTKVLWSTRDNDVAFVGTRGGWIQKWDTRTSSGPVASVLLSTEGGAIADIELSLNMDKITVACENKVVILSDKDLSVQKSHVMPESLNFKEEGGVSLRADGTVFFAGGSDLWVREFDAETGEVLRVMKGHHGPVRCVRYHPSGNMVASGSEDGTIRLWDLKNNTE